MTVGGLGRGSSEDPKQANNRENTRDDKGLDVLCTGLIGGSRKICYVKTEGGVIAQDTVEI